MPDDSALICAHCQLPFARVQHGALVIESRHHGDKHVNVLALDYLIRLLDGAGYTLHAPTEVEGLTSPSHTE